AETRGTLYAPPARLRNQAAGNESGPASLGRPAPLFSARSYARGFIPRGGSSPALAKPAHVALHAALRKLQLRATIRAGPDEVLARVHGLELHLRAAGADDLLHDGLGTRRGQRLGGREQLLLHALLGAHPVLERETDRVRHGEHLVGAEAHGAVGRDAAQL